MNKFQESGFELLWFVHSTLVVRFRFDSYKAKRRQQNQVFGRFSVVWGPFGDRLGSFGGPWSYPEGDFLSI